MSRQLERLPTRALLEFGQHRQVGIFYSDFRFFQVLKPWTATLTNLYVNICSDSESAVDAPIQIKRTRREWIYNSYLIQIWLFRSYVVDVSFWLNMFNYLLWPSNEVLWLENNVRLSSFAMILLYISQRIPLSSKSYFSYCQATRTHIMSLTLRARVRRGNGVCTRGPNRKQLSAMATDSPSLKYPNELSKNPYLNSTHFYISVPDGQPESKLNIV